MAPKILHRKRLLATLIAALAVGGVLLFATAQGGGEERLCPGTSGPPEGDVGEASVGPPGCEIITHSPACDTADEDERRKFGC